MCGRFAITLSPEAMRRVFAFSDQPNFPARYNIAPTQPIPIIRAERRDGEIARRFLLVRWAFLPSFAKNPKTFPLLFNARAEGLGSKRSFRNALRRRRCLVPADAFYEWRRSGTGKAARSQPYLFRRADRVTMALAGLWETWMGPDGEEVDTACIITIGANRLSAAIHPRLPVVIEEGDVATWLDPDETTFAAAAALLRTPDDHILTYTAISEAVNKVDNDDASIQMPIDLPVDAERPSPPVAEDRSGDQASLF